MRNSSRSFRTLTLAVALAYLFCFAPFSPAMAGWVTTQTVVESPKAKLASMVERQEVSEMLQSYGITPEEASRRVNGLTDAEAAIALAKIDEMPAAGDMGIIGAIVFIFLVLLVTDILGYTDVFPFANSQAK